jgi:hypothetical protein
MHERNYKDLQQGILQADRPVEEHIGFLERRVNKHILKADLRLDAYLSQVM